MSSIPIYRVYRKVYNWKIIANERTSEIFENFQLGTPFRAYTKITSKSVLRGRKCVTWIKAVARTQKYVTVYAIRLNWDKI